MCRFCRFFGREERVRQKRKPTSVTKSFKVPFRPALYTQHLEGQHPSKWAEYQALSVTDKLSFFSSVVPIGNTLHTYFVGAGDQVFFDIDAPIVDTIIRKMLFDPDANDETVESALGMFEPMHGATGDENTMTHYRVQIKNLKLFKLVIGQVALGSSFRLASRQIAFVREELSLGYLNGCKEAKVSRFVRVATAACLQKISELLKRVWAFSVAFDSSAIKAMSYFDVRVRFPANAQVHCFHLLALPLRGSHTGQLMFDVFKQAMDAILPEWEDRLLSTCSDGARNMLGRVRGIVSRIAERLNTASHTLITFWCGAHQFDLVMANVVQAYCDDSWYSTLTALIGFLRRQINLVNEMGSKCFKVATTRWLSLGKVLPWFGKNRARVNEYLNDKNPECNPTVSWWISLHALSQLVAEIDILFKYLQYEGLLVTQQREAFEQFIVCLRETFLLRGPLSSLQMASLDDEPKLCKGAFFVQLSDVSDLVNGLGSSVSAMFNALAEDERNRICSAFGTLLVDLADGVSQISPERDGDNEAVETSFPPVLPQEFARLMPSSFVQVVIRFRSRLEKVFGESYIDALEDEHRSLRDRYLQDPLLKNMLDSMNHTIGFHDAWVLLQSQFPKLCEFSGGVATIFPGTTRVESDFSIIDWEKDVYRSALIDFSLEGIVHSKQFKTLQSISRLAASFCAFQASF